MLITTLQNIINKLQNILFKKPIARHNENTLRLNAAAAIYTNMKYF